MKLKLYENFDIEDLSEAQVSPDWEVSSAKRKDGVVFNIGDCYEDMNKDKYTIKRMWVNPTGHIFAEAEEGGSINLFNVKKPLAC